jgi:hypothetical protein
MPDHPPRVARAQARYVAAWPNVESYRGFPLPMGLADVEPLGQEGGEEL